MSQGLEKKKEAPTLQNNRMKKQVFHQKNGNDLLVCL